MRKISQLLLAVALTVGLVATVGAAPADAATRSVSVHKIATKTAPYKKSVKVSPNVTIKGQVKVDSKRLTVKKGSSTVAENKSSVYLNAGTYKVTTTVKYRYYSVKKGKRFYGKNRTKTLTQTLTIKQKHPSRTSPVSPYDCPSWAPIKGNASSMIYHLPGQRFYNATKPEDCFSSESAARNAGYRKAKV